MADYFTHFSCLADVGTPERATRAIDFFVALCDEDDKSEEPQFHGFDLSVQDGPQSGVLWIHDDEYGDVEAVTAFILRLAEDLDLSGLWGFEHSNTCSRPQLNAFGGGANLIDLGARKVICWVNTQSWLADALNGEEIPMPDIICTTVYQFPELSDAANEKARSWYREAAFHDDWWDAVYDDFEHVCDILGVSLTRRSVRLTGGGNRQKPCIWFSGFSSQGDGASFEATVGHAKGSTREIRAHASKDQALHSVADSLQAAQRQNFYQLSADVTHRGRYYHEYCMTIDVSRDGPTAQPLTQGSEETVVEALRDLARWLYRRLEAEYDHLTSDEAIAEGIVINEYTFIEGGRRFG